jgi:protease-4
VLAYLTGGGTRESWLASAATSVAAQPGATLMVNGLAKGQLYLKDGLARLGVVVEVAKAGAYKSAPEPLTRSGPSDESKAMTSALLDDVSGRMRADIAAGRRLPPERVAALIDQGLFSASEAKAAGLVDELLWPDEVQAWSQRTLGRPGRLAPGGRRPRSGPPTAGASRRPSRWCSSRGPSWTARAAASRSAMAGWPGPSRWRRR